MLRISFLALAVGFLTSSASGMPMAPMSPLATASVVDVKIICEADGYCFKRGRKPVARWVYGEGAFYGPYSRPGNYGNPRYHHWWWPFW